MTTRLLMTADAVGGVWQYATELAAALVPHGVETTIAVLGPAPSAEQLADLYAGAEAQARLSPHSIRHPGLEPGPMRGTRVREGAVEQADARGCRIKSGMTETVGAGGVRVLPTDLPLDWLAAGPDPVLAAGQALADLARDLRADIVHLNSPTLAARARFAQPVVAVAHGCVATWWRAANGCAPDPAYAWQADLMRAGLLAADVAVAPSISFAADLQATYALPTAPLAIHNGRTPLAPSPLWGASGRSASQADLNRPGDGLPDAGRGEGQYVKPAAHAFTAGRLWDRVKGTAILDRVAQRLSVPLRAAGALTGPHGETVAPEHLTLLGNLSAPALAAELARQPVFVSAATFEPFGLAVLEAAQAGCALVLSDIPTFRELWDGAALFVPADNDAAYVAVIEELIADPIQREALGQAALRRAARYTPEATAAAMADIYARLSPARKAAA
ncbi:glycosyltransferase family 4 protein [Sphingomonas lenta]|uniref:Glycosyl transferase family 1 n=1 Tax=Sphingomonas lenta TaxID=1141887 RepID=A0A2A2SHD7_9SPHN|nr:glycosyltransferase family 4 protein [Sphingomonas lenta]PAX08625.1 glycosyl transferase family 1 [Sphingomonas lenta]